MVVSTMVCAAEADAINPPAPTTVHSDVTASRPMGPPNNGCIFNATTLDPSSVLYRLVHWDRPDRSVPWNYGDQSFVEYTEALAKQIPAIFDWGADYVLGIGDVSQEGGGRAFGKDPRTHRSHQRGLDGDFLYFPIPQRSSNQQPLYAPWTPLVTKDGTGVNEAFSKNQQALERLLLAAGSPKQVAAIFVHARIKEALCKSPLVPPEVQRKIISWEGHDKHFHVRLRCPNPSDSACIDWEYTEDGQNGCGTNLQKAIYALTHPTHHPAKTQPPLVECAVLFKQLGRPIRTPLPTETNAAAVKKPSKRTAG